MLKEEFIRVYDVYKNCEFFFKIEQVINSEKISIEEQVYYLDNEML